MGDGHGPASVYILDVDLASLSFRFPLWSLHGNQMILLRTSL